MSRRVRALVDEIGVSLFERRRDGVGLTIAGREFLARIGSALAEVDYAAQSAKVADRTETGSLTIAFYQSLASGHLQTLLASYRSVELDRCLFGFRRDGHDRSARGVARSTRRVHFLFAADHIVGVDSELLWNEPAFLAMPANHPFAKRDAVRWADLHDQEFIMRAHQSGIAEFACLAERLKSGGFDPNIRLHRVSREGLLGLVAAGYGVTVVSKAACGTTYSCVVFLAIDDVDAMLPVRMAWLAENDNPALRRFLSHVRVGARSMQRDH